jgi:serine/threonine-protein phosphatase PGAM5
VGTRTIVLLRHGQYDFEAAGSLTAVGREQARASGRHLSRMPFDAIWSSTLARAKETALIVAKQLSRHASVRHSALLREGMFSRIEGYEVPADEQREDRARADLAWSKFFRTSRPDRTELLVCHGNLIRYFICRSLDVRVARWTRMTTNHCGVTRILVRDTGAVRVVSYNETGHLPSKLVT